MILPDLNLLIYAYNTEAPRHQRAKAWWETCLTEDRPVGLSWIVLVGYIRLMTGRQLREDPLTIQEALEHIRSWLERPHVEILEPGPRHLELLGNLISAAQAVGNLATDAHLAALAIENRAELHSNDAEFSRFSGLRWRNPIA